MTTFLSQLAGDTNLTYTENGAVTNISSQDPIVDFFGLAGAMRDTPDKAADLFEKAFRAEPLTAVRTLFYLRDVRGGQGERDVFRRCFTRLGNISPQHALGLLPLIPEYGRWDDLLHVEAITDASKIIGRQLMQDLTLAEKGQPVSLLGKWLPSENASSPKTKALAKGLRMRLNMTPAGYRRALSQLRKQIRLLEHDMSGNNWREIEYGKLPGQAHRKHTKAFRRHTPERYQAYLDSVERGEAKINVNTVYPYELYEMINKSYQFENNNYVNVAWNNLPDYTNGNNALVMADVSGSMQGRPMAVSVSLALYFAERNKGAFNGYFMTFSGNPKLVKIHGNNLAQRMQNIENSDWGGNTDLLLAFQAILSAAKSDPVNAPKTLYVISDMEFDAATSAHGGWQMVQQPETYVQTPFGIRVRPGGWTRVHVPGRANDTVFNTARAQFAAAGIPMPHVVFWNVDARQEQAPATVLDGQVSLVSGCSATTFGMVVEGKSPRELVESVVNSERYARITL